MSFFRTAGGARRALPLALAGATFALVASSSVSLAGFTVADGRVDMRTGAHNAPVSIAGTSSGSQVARLSLTKGNWTVFAKGVIRNTSGSTAFHPVACTLKVGGKTDKVRLSPGGAGGASNSEAFLLVAGANLNGSSAATLRCAAPGTSSGTMVAQSLRLTAFKTVSLSLEEAATTVYGDTQALSRIVHRVIPGSTAFGTSNQSIASLQIPTAGPWAITAKATVVSTSGAITEARCALSAGDTDRLSTNLQGKGTAGDRRPIALEIVHSFGASTSVGLSCLSTKDGATAIKDVRIVAYRLSVLRNQNLANDPYFPIGGAMTLVNAGYKDGPLALLAGPFKTQAQMQIDAGYWTLIGKVFLDPTAGVPGAVTCQLGTSGEWDTVKLVLGAQNSGDDMQPATFLWSGTYPARTTVTLRCKTATSGSIANWIKITAYEGSSLKVLAI